MKTASIVATELVENWIVLGARSAHLDAKVEHNSLSGAADRNACSTFFAEAPQQIDPQHHAAPAFGINQPELMRKRACDPALRVTGSGCSK